VHVVLVYFITIDYLLKDFHDYICHSSIPMVLFLDLMPHNFLFLFLFLKFMFFGGCFGLIS